jgi:hypothetical protein
VTAGRIVFVQSGAAATTGFGLTVSDGDWVVGPRQVEVVVASTEAVPPPGRSSDPGPSMEALSPRFEPPAPANGGRQELSAGTGAADRIDRMVAEMAAGANGAAATRGAGRLSATDRDSNASAMLGASSTGLALEPGLVRAPAVAASAVGPGASGERSGRVRGDVASPSATAPDMVRLPSSELLVMLDAPIDLSGFVQERPAMLQWARTDERSRGSVESASPSIDEDDAPALRWDSGSAGRVGGMALSVGVVFWATRATGLLASLIAVSPPWRQFDPLPVLSVHTPPPDGTEVEWLDTDISGSLAELAEDILDQRS